MWSTGDGSKPVAGTNQKTLEPRLPRHAFWDNFSILFPPTALFNCKADQGKPNGPEQRIESDVAANLPVSLVFAGALVVI